VDTYLLSLYLLVELAVPTLNAATFLEQLGYGQTFAHSFFFYATYVIWFFARVLLPSYNIYAVWAYIVPTISFTGADLMCTLPAVICGHIISGFCIGLFFFVWTPDVLARWRRPIIHLKEYDDYQMTMRQTNTPRSSPIHSKISFSKSTSSSSSYGTLPHEEP